MAELDTTVRKGAPGPEQLPQGAAQQVNEAMPEIVLPEAAPPALPAPATGAFRPKEPADESGSFLFGDGTGLRPRPARPRPPDEVIGWLPALARAATAPGAPASLRGLLRVVLDALDRED